MTKPYLWGPETTCSLETQPVPFVEPTYAPDDPRFAKLTHTDETRSRGPLTLEDIQAAARPVILLNEAADPIWLRDGDVMGGGRARRRARRQERAQ